MIRILRYDYATVRDKHKLKEIYEESFPKCERFDFEILVKCNKESNVHLDCLILDDVVVGMAFSVLLPNNVLYLMYFAIDEKCRNKGIGSKAIRNCVVASNILMLIIEQPANELTQKRKEFYIKNGLSSTGIKFEDSCVVYEILVSDRTYIPSEMDLLNRYKCTTKNKVLWRRIKRTFNTEQIVIVEER